MDVPFDLPLEVFSIEIFVVQNLSHLSGALILMETARVDVSTSTFIMVHCLAMNTIYLSGSEAQKQKFLPKMAKLEKIGCFALSEPNHGSDAAKLDTTAKKVDGGWILNGQKRWIGNGTWADVSVVYARNIEDGKQVGFIVEKGTPGFTTSKIENKISLRVVQKSALHSHFPFLTKF
jgi:acyl-CoA oxidase